MTIFLKRNTNIYVSTAPNASANATNTVLLNVKDFSFNQSSVTRSVGRETLDPDQERIFAPHIEALSPVNFSFTTYILSVLDTNVTTPDEYFWTSLVGDSTAITSSPTQSAIDFADGNVSTLPELTLWFNDPSQPEGNYRVDNAIIDSATINFNISSIAEINWRGRALSMTQDNTAPASTDRTGLDNYIKNKLTTLTIDSNTLALTGGSLTIDNNVSFYGRTTLDNITRPTGHYTNNRSIIANLSVYLKSGSLKGVDIFNAVIDNVENPLYESFFAPETVIDVGGVSNTPRFNITLPRTVIGMPQQNFNEAISINIPITSYEGTGNYATITYVI